MGSRSVYFYFLMLLYIFAWNSWDVRNMYKNLVLLLMSANSLGQSQSSKFDGDGGPETIHGKSMGP